MVNWNWDAPRPLVESFSQGLVVKKETLELLREINAPVTAVVIVGPYRTGKSYLLNRLAGKNTGFAIGSTIQAMTKGIWVWCCSHPRDPETCLLLIDTEGLGDPKKGDKNHDVWIFILAVLLSSTLIYNNMKTIDQDALSTLHLITKLSEHMQTQAKPANNSRYHPNFVWAVRDFYLELELDEKPCTADEYLEDALSIKPGEDIWTKKYNQIRQCLGDFFPSRKCFVFPQPLNNMKMVKNLEDLQDSDFDETFLSASEEFLQYVWNKSKPMSIGDGLMKVKDLADLCDLYVQKIQEGGVPCIKESVEVLKQLRNREALDKAIQLYKLELQTIELPTEKASLSKHHQKCQKAAMEGFKKDSFFDDDQDYEYKLNVSIQEIHGTFCSRNEDLTRCRERLEQLFQSGGTKEFKKRGGYDRFLEYVKELKEKYDKQEGSAIEVQNIFSKFKAQKEDEILKIHGETTQKICENMEELQKQRPKLIEKIKKEADQLDEQQKTMNIFKAGGSAVGIVSFVALGAAVMAPAAAAFSGVAVGASAISALAGTAASVVASMKINSLEEAAKEKIKKTVEKDKKLSQNLAKSVSEYDPSDLPNKEQDGSLTNICKSTGLLPDENAKQGLPGKLFRGAELTLSAVSKNVISGTYAIFTGNGTAKKMREVEEASKNLKTLDSAASIVAERVNMLTKQQLESKV